MAVIRVNKTKDFTVMSNTHLRDRNLTLKAKGLLCLMFSLPDKWDYSINGLCSICVENQTAINNVLKELKNNGYLVIDKLMPNQTKSGRIEYTYSVYEKPQIKKQDIEKQDLENLGLENLGLENLGVENQGQYNTNIYNTNIYNKENKINSNKKDLLESKQAFRELKEKEQKALHCNTLVTNCNTEIEIEKDIEKEQENKSNVALGKNSKTDILSFEEEAFNQFWKLYPKKINKEGCLRAFKRIPKLKEELPKIINSVEKNKKSDSWLKSNGQFIPYPSTFINQRRWEVEIEETREDKLKDLDMSEWWKVDVK